MSEKSIFEQKIDSGSEGEYSFGPCCDRIVNENDYYITVSHPNTEEFFYFDKFLNKNKGSSVAKVKVSPQLLNYIEGGDYKAKWLKIENDIIKFLERSKSGLVKLNDQNRWYIEEIKTP